MFQAIYSKHYNAVIFPNSIYVHPENPSHAIGVMVRVRLNFGSCRIIAGAFYDLETKEITVNLENTWQNNIFLYLSKRNLVPNLSLKGPEVDAMLVEANAEYRHIMSTGTLCSVFKTIITLNSYLQGH